MHALPNQKKIYQKSLPTNVAITNKNVLILNEFIFFASKYHFITKTITTGNLQNHFKLIFK